MKRALLLVAIAACEKDRGAHVAWKLPAVGDRETYHERSDSHVTAPDGNEHAGHNELSMTMEVEVATNGRVDRMRVVVDRHDRVFDHAPKRTLSGTYEVTADGTATRADGKPLGDDEARFFRAWHIDNDIAPLLAHEFHAGETYRPSAGEAEALGLPPAKDPWVLHVKIAAASEIVLAAEYTPHDSPPELDAHDTLVVTLTPLANAHVDDMVLRRQAKDIGGAHITTELRRLPQR